MEATHVALGKKGAFLETVFCRNEYQAGGCSFSAVWSWSFQKGNNCSFQNGIEGENQDLQKASGVSDIPLGKRQELAHNKVDHHKKCISIADSMPVVPVDVSLIDRGFLNFQNCALIGHGGRMVAIGAIYAGLGGKHVVFFGSPFYLKDFLF
ncbi:hypothetical protein SUGI_1095170 [Cryptomeria japonica]|nr:hypothetical protein SUGI_1095170 [Cryptomeria japonica]